MRLIRKNAQARPPSVAGDLSPGAHIREKPRTRSNNCRRRRDWTTGGAAGAQIPARPGAARRREASRRLRLKARPGLPQPRRPAAPRGSPRGQFWPTCDGGSPRARAPECSSASTRRRAPRCSRPAVCCRRAPCPCSSPLLHRTRRWPTSIENPLPKRRRLHNSNNLFIIKRPSRPRREVPQKRQLCPRSDDGRNMKMKSSVLLLRR
jgi:hypothetical protein